MSVENGIRREERRLAKRYAELQERYAGDPERFAARWREVAHEAALRRAQRPHPPAQHVLPDRARPPDGPAHGRVRAADGPRLPAPRADGGVGPRALPCKAVGPCASITSASSWRTSRPARPSPGTSSASASPHGVRGGRARAGRRLLRHGRRPAGDLHLAEGRAPQRAGDDRPHRRDRRRPRRRAGAAGGAGRALHRARRRPTRSRSPSSMRGSRHLWTDPASSGGVRYQLVQPA